MFPSMLDHYQVQLTRMLEAEQYGEAKELLRFLLQCQGEDERHYEEWDSLLTWLDMAFPEDGSSRDDTGFIMANVDKDDENEALMREQILNPPDQDEAYVNQVLYIMQHHPMIDQQMLALERAAYVQAEDINDTIIEWLMTQQVHPVVQFKALQCLRKRGASGTVTIERLGEIVELEMDATPLSMDDFPEPVNRILNRTEQVAEVDDPTLPHFARELWKESLQFLYGTAAYHWMLREDEDTVDCFAAALHLTLLLTVYGSANDDDIRDTYGITEGLRFRYEQACRALRQVALLQQSGDDEPQS
ncbi:hypothetical protein [Paenibacillus prosopidis]|uniref:Uncharacterized protein n=1 Tax=Paenibacillus prosopidis TaxID=630520 RepID=A0A368VRR5_9BACL|nr:hypothetical protein [Paenibacillus prosopidis]RCW42646.1 hypothetical protein DFP97_11578 [Paenibacillus prosopidis]